MIKVAIFQKFATSSLLLLCSTLAACHDSGPQNPFASPTEETQQVSGYAHYNSDTPDVEDHTLSDGAVVMVDSECLKDKELPLDGGLTRLQININKTFDKKCYLAVEIKTDGYFVFDTTLASPVSLCLATLQAQDWVTSGCSALIKIDAGSLNVDLLQGEEGVREQIKAI